jgi:hypothetical protein
MINFSNPRWGSGAAGNVKVCGQMVFDSEFFISKTSAMSTLFLSHSSKDCEPVLRLAKDLRKRGISVWLDEWEIDVGDPITEKIQAGLSHAQYVAVWLTKDSVNSGWVTKEWHTKI